MSIFGKAKEAIEGVVIGSKQQRWVADQNMWLQPESTVHERNQGRPSDRERLRRDPAFQNEVDHLMKQGDSFEAAEKRALRERGITPHA